MKKLFFVFSGFLLLSACTVNKPLYTWADYEKASYMYLKNADEKATQELIENYQEVIEKQKGTRGVVPPGIYADYGFVLLQADRADDGKQMLQKEIALYPESEVFITRILKMIEQ